MSLQTILSHTAAYKPDFRQPRDVVASVWCRSHDLHTIKLLYLLDLPDQIANQYPRTNAEGIAILSTPGAELKRALPAYIIAERIDPLPCKDGIAVTWTPAVVRIMSHNPCTAKSPEAKKSMQRQFDEFKPAVVGAQEARNPESGGKSVGEKWWVALSAEASNMSP